MIAELLDTPDTAGVVRDAIRAVLVAESANQVSLAIAASVDPAPYDFETVVERYAMIDNLKTPAGLPRERPVVNVRVNTVNYSEDMVDPVLEQRASPATYWIDCYVARSAEDTVQGHDPGDFLAQTACEALTGLIRRIIMSGEYQFLGLTGDVVHDRRIRDVQYFDPQVDNAQAFHVAASRLVLEVCYTDLGPEQAAATLDQLNATLLRQSDGVELAELDFDYTT